MVDDLVQLIFPVVFQSIFDRNNSEDGQQGEHSDLLLERFHQRDPVQEDQKEEVQIGCSKKEKRGKKKLGTFHFLTGQLKYGTANHDDQTYEINEGT